MAEMQRPLDGVRVLDVSEAVGAYCTRLLCGLGADVVKVEPPEGDELRRRPPFRDGSGTSLPFAYYHAGKRGITLDTRRTDSVALLAELARDADVVVISPSSRRPLAGFDAKRPGLTWAHDEAIVCSVTAYGLTGPYRNRRTTHFVAHATSGQMHGAGPPEGPPVAVPGQAHWDEAGAHAAVCVLAALLNRETVGGQTIDVSAHEVAAAKDFTFERYDAQGMSVDRSVRIGYPPTGTWQCADGAFDVAAHQPRHWDAFLATLDHPSELADESLRDVLVRREIFDGLVEIIAKLMAHRSRYELLERGQAAGLPCAVLHTPAEFISDEQLSERGYVVTLPAHDGQEVRVPGAPIRSVPALFAIERGAPRLGEHNEEVYLGELAHTRAELDAWKAIGLA